jgi:hypothetical protein
MSEVQYEPAAPVADCYASRPSASPAIAGPVMTLLGGRHAA